MAFTRTTLSSACAATDKQIVVASATGFAAGQLVKIDMEIMQIAKSYTSGTTIPVLRGLDGSLQAAHVVTAGVMTTATVTDWDTPTQQTSTNYPTQRPTVITSVTATSSLTLPDAGSDMRVILNGTSVITLTVPVPTTDMDGCNLVIVSNGAAAHVITFTGGLGAAGTNYDVITNNATGQMALSVYAANGTWCIPQAPALTGTVTNITGGIA